MRRGLRSWSACVLDTCSTASLSVELFSCFLSQSQHLSIARSIDWANFCPLDTSSIDRELRNSNFQIWFSVCKVEFNQPFYWLYSVPNLLVFQYLVTLYLGGFVVRAVSKIECWLLKSVQENRGSRLDLAGDLRLPAARCSTRAKHAGRWTVC